MAPSLFFHALLKCLLCFAIQHIASPSYTIRSFSYVRGLKKDTFKLSNPDDIEIFSYNQTLDHFNYKSESYATFKQRYGIDSKYWGGSDQKAPIFAYLGAEASMDEESPVAFLTENAPHFRALIVYIEHRFYGKSNPLGSMKESLKNESIRGYFNSAQALQDYAEILLHIKKNLSALNSPIIVIGGSYGGMLAAWFRLKYPHIALGAVASSSPLLYFDNITRQDGYYSVVSKDFKETSESCYETIKKSWNAIDDVASKPGGLSILGQRFNTCMPLKSSFQLKDFLMEVYSRAAQYNSPTISEICGYINSVNNETDILEKIIELVTGGGKYFVCVDTREVVTETSMGWHWQTCSEMVMPIGITNDFGMFQRSPFNLDHFITKCNDKFGVTPRPHWVTTYYGGHNIKLVLEKFGSNIIFTNGLKDPYSSGGVLEDISESILAIHTKDGYHCMDLLATRDDDPQWLRAQRKAEVKVIELWIKKYYDDLHALLPSS